MKLEFSRHNFEKFSNIKFHKNPSSGSRLDRCGRTDGHYEANSRFSQFYECAWKKNTEFQTFYFVCVCVFSLVLRSCLDLAEILHRKSVMVIS